MTVTYTYSVSADFVGLVVPDPDLFLLDLEIGASGIIPVYQGNLRDSDSVYIYFASALSGPEESTLDAVVAAHTGLSPLATGGTEPHGIDYPGAPNNDNDETQGITIGSIWVDNTTGDVYIATSVANGAATWQKVSDDELLKISATDTTPDYLSNKVITTEGLQSTVLNPLGNSDLQLKLDINGLTVDNAPDGASDYVVTWDVSSSTHKKVLLNSLPSSGSGTGCYGELYESNETGTEITISPALTWNKWSTSSSGDTTGGTVVTANTSLDRLVIGSSGAGVYFVSASGAMESSGSSTVYMELRKNGVVTGEGFKTSDSKSTGQRLDLGFTGLMDLVSGDYLELWLTADNNNTRITIFHLNLSIVKMVGSTGAIGPAGPEGPSCGNIDGGEPDTNFGGTGITDGGSP